MTDSEAKAIGVSVGREVFHDNLASMCKEYVPKLLAERKRLIAQVEALEMNGNRKGEMKGNGTGESKTLTALHGWAVERKPDTRVDAGGGSSA